MVKQNLLKRLLGNLRGLIKDLEDCRSVSLADFRRDVKTRRYVERTLHMAVETVLDLTHHIISDENLREPQNYADAFLVLGEAKVIPMELADSCRKMAQFRNLLVHAYERIDPDQIYAIIQRNLNDFSTFAQSIATYMETST